MGDSAFWLARTYGVSVIGVTLVASQVARARRYATQARLTDRVSFEQQDYTATTFADGGFDVVWALESACHARDKQQLLRVLRPGGRLGMVEYMRVSRLLATPADEHLLHS